MMFSVLQTCCCSSGCSCCSKALLKGLEWLAQQSCIQQDHCNPASTSILGINPYWGPYNPDFKSSFGACNVLWFNICPKIVMWNCALLVVEPCSDQSCVELYIYVFIYIPEACGHVDSLQTVLRGGMGSWTPVWSTPISDFTKRLIPAGLRSCAVLRGGQENHRRPLNPVVENITGG